MPVRHGSAASSFGIFDALSASLRQGISQQRRNKRLHTAQPSLSRQAEVGVISRPLVGGSPTIDLVIGYGKTNASQPLLLFLSRVDDLIAGCRKKLSDIKVLVEKKESARMSHSVAFFMRNAWSVTE